MNTVWHQRVEGLKRYGLMNDLHQAGFAARNPTLTGAGCDPLQVPAGTSTHEVLPMVGVEPILGHRATGIAPVDALRHQ